MLRYRKVSFFPHFPLSCQFKQLLTFLVSIGTSKAVLWYEEIPKSFEGEGE